MESIYMLWQTVSTRGRRRLPILPHALGFKNRGHSYWQDCASCSSSVVSGTLGKRRSSLRVYSIQKSGFQGAFESQESLSVEQCQDLRSQAGNLRNQPYIHYWDNCAADT